MKHLWCFGWIIVLLTVLSDHLPAKETDEAITIGSKKFTENVVLGEMVALYLKHEGLQVRHRQELGSTRILWEALQRGDMNLYPDYTGTLQYEILRNPELENWEDLRQALEQQGVGITRSLGFNNTYAIGMRRDHAAQLGIDSISDLKKHPQLRYGLGHEFLDRADGWPGLSEHYGLNPTHIKGVDHDIGYRGIDSGSIDVIDLYTTDAEIEYYDLIALADDRNFFPRYEAVLVYRLDLAESVRQHLADFEDQITTSQMSKMNADVKIHGHSAAQVAADFLAQSFDIRVDDSEQNLWEGIQQRTVEHLLLVVVSMSGAILIAIPLGYIASQWPKGGHIILSVTGIIQTIPSLALLVLMIPLFGIGAVPAMVALFLYSLLPIVRGTYLGFTSISTTVREAAQSLGLPASSRFRYIYLPLAVSSILSGIKTSAVINVGTATLGALIGAGGFGQTIIRGIRLDDTNLIMAGALPAAGLALLVQWSFDFIEKIVVSEGLRS
jgi:osmoprotectant transport system permease protein